MRCTGAHDTCMQKTAFYQHAGYTSLIIIYIYIYQKENSKSDDRLNKILKFVIFCANEKFSFL